jgi:RNA polymerase sigma factor (sigma-70 family)
MIATGRETSDLELVAAVRNGHDAAFEELYERYRPRIASFVRGMVRDAGRAEDLTQEAFVSALRRLRETDSEIAFKPWIYRIARNQAIDSHRRSARAEEISMDAERGLRPSDHSRLVDADAPDAALVAKERLDHLCGAFDELSDIQARVIVMRELEGRSYREIAETLDMTRPAVEGALFRARRRLESEYAELSEGRRCAAMRTTIARLAEGLGGHSDQARLTRHARRCSLCRRRARELGVEPLSTLGRVRAKVAALLPLPWGLQGTGSLGSLIGERAAALAAIAAIGAGGAAVGVEQIGGGPERPGADSERAAEQRSAQPPAAHAPRPAAEARRDTRQRSRAARRERARRGAAAAPRERRRTEPGAAPGPASNPAPPQAPASAAGSEPGLRAPVPALPRIPDVRSGLPRLQQVPGAGSPPQLPQAPQLPPSVQPGGAPGVSVPPQVADPVNGVVGGVNGTVQGALP